MPPHVPSGKPNPDHSSDLMLDVAPAEPAWGHVLGQGVDGNELHYVRRGQGPPVLLLHGWPGFWYDWRRLIRPLSADVDVLAPEFRGFGDSPLPRGPAERTSGEGPLADDLARLMDDLASGAVSWSAYGSEIPVGLSAGPTRMPPTPRPDSCTHEPGYGPRRS